MTIDEVTLDRPEVGTGFSVICGFCRLGLSRFALKFSTEIFAPYSHRPCHVSRTDEIVVASLASVTKSHPLFHSRLTVCSAPPRFSLPPETVSIGLCTNVPLCLMTSTSPGHLFGFFPSRPRKEIILQHRNGHRGGNAPFQFLAQQLGALATPSSLSFTSILLCMVFSFRFKHFSSTIFPMSSLSFRKFSICLRAFSSNC